MPFEKAIIAAKPAGFFLRYIGQSIQKPTPVSIVVSGGGAVEGALSIPVNSLPIAVPRNSLLEFETSGGVVQCVVTAHALQGATSIAVESFHGAHGVGISGALAGSDTALWDTLYPDVGSESLDLQLNAQTEDLSAVTHGSSTSITVTQRRVSSIAPTAPRSGIFWDEPSGGTYVAPQVVKDIMRYSEGRGNFWGKYVIPNRAGERMIVQEAWGQISGVGTPSPANGRQELSYTFNFQDFLAISFNDEIGS